MSDESQNGYGPSVDATDREAAEADWLLDDDLELEAELELRRARLHQIDPGELH